MNKLIKIKECVEISGTISDIIFSKNSIHSILPHLECRMFPNSYILTIGYDYFDNKKRHIAQSFIISKKDYEYIVKEFDLTSSEEF